jgi:two-component system CheB/CheR fusion protein
VDFTHYKRSTIQRRLGRRMALHPIEGLGAYAELLEDTPRELQALSQDLLIRVTNFFRDPETFGGLVETVFPALLQGRSATEPLRIWVPGCASGEEVYSIAICLIEFLGERATNTPIQIFGTDVSETAIDKARAGLYLDNITGEVSSARLGRFFVKLDDHYQIAKSIRDLCIFARQNLTSDPPFSRLDLVSCRNLLIYLDHVLQRQVILLFHYALKSGGFLVLGPAENIGQSPELFDLIDKRHKIYRKCTLPRRLGLELGAGAPATRRDARERAAGAASALVHGVRGQREVERLLLARYNPACILIDEGLNILYFQGETSRYLEHARGPASLNLQKLARPGLLVELAAAIQAARTEGAPVRREGIRVETEGAVRETRLEVIPVKLPDTEAGCYLILFEEAAPRATQQRTAPWLARWWPKTPRGAPETEKDRQILQLKHELEATRDYLQTAIEEHEAAQEELKSAHEEALSATEEFQSTNEELETAKEELQSANEELTTTNEEIRNRNRELSELNEALAASRDYADAMIETLREPVVVLDGGLRVMRANRAFYECFKTTAAETESCFLYDLGNRQWNIPALRTLLEEILPQNRSLWDYEVTHTFPTIGIRTMRLNARRLPGDQHRPELILLALEDISARMQIERALIFQEKERYRITLAAISEGVIATNAAGEVEYMNGSAEHYTGWHQAEAQGLLLSQVFNVVDEHTREVVGNVAQIAMGKGQTVDASTQQLLLLRRDGVEFSIDTVSATLHDGRGNPIGTVLTFRDVTESRRLTQQLSHQAAHDALTGLVNRQEFERRLRRVIESADPLEPHILLYLDLDQFKLVNDTCGHTAGDELLRQIAAILPTRMRTRDTLARLGGDEFGVLLEHCPIDEAVRIANDIRRSVHDFRFTWQDQRFSLGISIGLVSVMEAGDTVERVLSAADSACYAAKDRSRNQVHVYQPDDREMAERHGHMQWVPRIQGALAEGRFRLYYQPIVTLGPTDAESEWGEILLRLVDEQGKLVLPGAFLPAAERYDQMGAIDRWVIGQALTALRRQAPGAPPACYAINVSGQSFNNGDLLEFVTEHLDGIEPGQVCFEITETAAIGNLRAAMGFISTLKARGCHFALDDFGSGLSSFAYLKTLPVDHLKIDGRFIRNMRQDPTDRAMVEAIHRIGHVMGLKTIAEWVEDTATLKALRALGVDYAQGVGIAPPRALELG